MNQQSIKALQPVLYAAVLSIAAFYLAELLLQLVLPAHYEARFDNLSPAELSGIQLQAQQWQSMNPRAGLVMSPCESSPPAGAACSTLTFQALGNGFRTMSDLLADIHHGGKVSVLRSPDDRTSALAWLLAALLFLSLVVRSTGPQNPIRERHRVSRKLVGPA